MLKDFKLWGTNSEEVKSYGSKYLLFKYISLAFIVMITFVLYYMVDTYMIDVGNVLRMLLLLSILESIFLNFPLRGYRETLVRAYEFKKKHKKDKIDSLITNISVDDLYVYLYRVTKTKPVKNESIDYYINIINKACSGFNNFPSKFMKNLEVKEAYDNSEKLKVFYCENKKNKRYLIGIEVVKDMKEDKNVRD